MDQMQPAITSKSKIRTARRVALLAFATRNCLPTAECIDPDELASMPIGKLRQSVRFDVEMHPWPEEIRWF